MQYLASVLFFLLVRISAYGVSGTANDVIKRTLSAVSSSEFMTRCYEPYGCFSISPPWTSSSRPINHFPQSARDIAPGYCLYSRKLKGLCTDVTSHELLSASNYNRNVSTIVVTHGYLENGRKKWIKRMVDELLLHHDVNIIVLDWVRGSGPPYTQAVSNIRLIGRMVAHYLLNLSELFAHNLAEFHFIGHSLGSHLAGYTGETLKEYGVKLGRITGLDPAEPYFQGTEGLIRLDPSDAQFVDVIHTDGGPIISGGLGLLQPVGHLDFYPNGGVKQPGCGGSVLDSIEKEKGSLVYGLRRFIGCNHIMAYEFFTESIRPAKCPFLSIECGSSEEFYSGSCTSCGVNGTRCHVMGMKSSLFYSKNSHGKYPEDVTKPVKAFLLTGSEKPFCRFHHRISVLMSDTDESFVHGGDRGFLYLTLAGESGATEVFQLSQQ